MIQLTVRALEHTDAPQCDAVLATLPTFFGDPDGIRDCAAAVRSEAGFVAAGEDGVAGFVTLQAHFSGSAEITWLAVAQAYRRQGIGRMLVEAAAEERTAAGDGQLFVLTLGPSVREDHEDNYDGTRAFYRRMGFVPLRELGLSAWNNSHALILARALR